MDLTISAEDLRKTMQDEQEDNFQSLMSDIRAAAAHGCSQLATMNYGFNRGLLDTHCHAIIGRLQELGYGVRHQCVGGRWRTPAQLVVTW